MISSKRREESRGILLSRWSVSQSFTRLLTRLAEIIRYSGPDATVKRIPKAAQAQAQAQASGARTMLDQFVGKTALPELGSEEIVTNADGTMHSIEPETQDDEAL